MNGLMFIINTQTMNILILLKTPMVITSQVPLLKEVVIYFCVPMRVQ
jgi:hypothetical protein